MKRFGWVAVLAVCVAAPVWGGSFDKNDTLKEGEGILLMSIECSPGPVYGVQVFAEGTSSGGFFGPLKSAGDINCREGVATLRLKAGRYYVGQFYGATSNLAVPAEKSPHFNVEAGKLNYVGDLYVGGQGGASADHETQMRVLGRALTVLNHEPQMRQRLQDPKHAWMASYAFVVDKDLPPPVPVGPMASLQPGQSQVTLKLGSNRWKRGADAQPVVCRRLVPLPEGFKPVPGEPPRCDGDFIPLAQFVAEEYGDDARLNRAETFDGDEGALTVSVSAKTRPLSAPFSGMWPGTRPTETVRRQLEIPAGRWSNGRHGVAICYSAATAEAMDIANAPGKDCSENLVTTREYLRVKVGGNARFVSSATSGMGGAALLINYDIDVPKP